MFRHIVLFRVYDEVSDLVVEEAIERLRSLSAVAGIREFIVELSSDLRKGRIIVEDVTFDDEAAFQRFRSSAEHAAVAAFLATLSDWWIGDYERD